MGQPILGALQLEAAGLVIDPLNQTLRRLPAGSLRSQKHSWMRYAGAVASGAPGSSASVNEVIYNEPRP